jgi:hypothetical protein
MRSSKAGLSPIGAGFDRIGRPDHVPDAFAPGALRTQCLRCFRFADQGVPQRFPVALRATDWLKERASAALDPWQKDRGEGKWVPQGVL